MFWYKTKNKFFTLYTHNGLQTYYSEEVINILGYEPSELIGKSAYDFFHPSDLTRVSKSHLEIVNTSHMTTSVYRMRHKLGNYIWLRSFSQNTGESLVSITKRLNKIEILFVYVKSFIKNRYNFYSE